MLSENQKNFVDLCVKEFGDVSEVTRKQLIQVEKKHKVGFQN